MATNSRRSLGREIDRTMSCKIKDFHESRRRLAAKNGYHPMFRTFSKILRIKKNYLNFCHQFPHAIVLVAKIFTPLLVK